MSEIDYHLHTLPNGLRIAHKQVTHTKVAHCGFILDIGSRDEDPDLLGIAHFWEHMAFKGTTHRKAFHIINSLDSVGGELNAYTTKEKVCFYASVLAPHFKRAADLLTDITFNSIFPLKEIEKERQVILEEMAMYRDSPDDAIADDFEELVFQAHPLGVNILGTQETVSAMGREDFIRFYQSRLDTRRCVFASVSALPFKEVLKKIEPLLAAIPASYHTFPRLPFDKVVKEHKVVEKPISQAHFMMGRTALPLTDKRRLPLLMLINLLGGPAMNSRLNLAVREKYGLAYTVEAGYVPYTDSGLLHIYFGTEKKQLNKAKALVEKELKKLREVTLGTLQIHSIKEQLKGQLAISEESNLNLMLALGKSILDLGRMEPLPEIFKHIDSVSATDLQELAIEFLQPEDWCSLAFVPENGH